MSIDKPIGRALKRFIDITFSLVALVLVSPLFLLLAVAVRVASGSPVLYCQGRLGLHGRVFQILKFRTMSVNAPDLRNSDGSTVNLAGDPRVTPIGRVLRRTSLDELPQLWNVLKGDMSLVGPRPYLPDPLQYNRPQDLDRLGVKPGLTGWAAVHGRNDAPPEVRHQLDMHYIDHATVEMDIAILLRTIPWVLSGRGTSTSRSTRNK